MNGILQWLTDIAKTVQLWVVVLPWDRGVRVRLGKYTSLLEPGIHWKIPLVDKVWIVNNRLRFTSFPAQTLGTTDGKSITMAGVIGFRIADPLEAMLSLVQPEVSCAALAQTTIAEYVCSRTFPELDRAELEQECLADLQRVATGLTFEVVRLTDFALMRTLRIIKSEESWRPETRADKEPGE